MCRWAAWTGAPVFVQDIVTAPQHSLVVQSQQAAQSKTTINGDGFGLAWYDHRAEPGLYRDINPAWSDTNLPSIAAQVKSPLFLAHVRASTGTAVSRNNCHPFVVGRWSFMHNGQVGGFDQFRKRADMTIPDGLYQYRKGASDSEVIFLNALGYGLEDDPMVAMARAVFELEALSRDYGARPHMRFSAAFSNGKQLYAMRYASDRLAPTLYYRWSARLTGHMVVSEPLDQGATAWYEVPPKHIVCFEDGKVDTISLAALSAAS